MPPLKKNIIIAIALLLSITVHSQDNAFGWHDETHLSVAKAAEYKKWYNAAGADMAKIKADRIERNNHYCNNPQKVEVTPEMVLRQVEKYNDPVDTEGHLYGAILTSLREYRETTETGKYAEYHLAFCAHYVGDLSQPLHNYPDDLFNLLHHKTNDGIVEEEVFEKISKIQENMYPIILRKEYFEEDLAREIARIANIARKLGYKLQEENRDMTKEEAYKQLGHSASLLKAILKYIEGIQK
jgi:hypothetical protein